MTMDDLCGNTFHRNQMTVTKYIAGKMILTKLKKLVAQRKEREKKNLDQPDKTVKEVVQTVISKKDNHTDKVQNLADEPDRPHSEDS